MPALAGSVLALVTLGLVASGCGGDDTTGGGGSPTGTPTAVGGGGTGGTGGSGLTGGGGTGGTGGGTGATGGGGEGGGATGGASAFADHEFVNSGELVSSTNYEMVFSLGQSTLHQGECTSANYRYVGGLIGVVGE